MESTLEHLDMEEQDIGSHGGIYLHMYIDKSTSRLLNIRTMSSQQLPGALLSCWGPNGIHQNSSLLFVDSTTIMMLKASSHGQLNISSLMNREGVEIWQKVHTGSKVLQIMSTQRSCSY